MIFISKENKSLADIFSKTNVERKTNQISMSNATSLQTTSINNPEISESAINNISDLHKLIVQEKKKIFPGKNKLITEKLEELFKDKNSFFGTNSIYKDQYSKEIPEHLMSISSAYGLIYYYVEPLIKLGICEEDFPHKITDHED